MKKEHQIFAVSGVKNSGKTTLITRILPYLTDSGLKVATIKHDGHDFNADVPGTDTYRHLQAGAYGTAIFSDLKFMVTKQQPHLTETELIEWFPEADLVLLEGFKTCPYPKIELIRKGNSVKSVCEGYNLTAVATDLEPDILEWTCGRPDIPILDLNNPRKIASFILESLPRPKELRNYIQQRTGQATGGFSDTFVAGNSPSSRSLEGELRNCD